MRRADGKSSRNWSERFAQQIGRREGAEGATVAFRGRCVLGRNGRFPEAEAQTPAQRAGIMRRPGGHRPRKKAHGSPQGDRYA